jgi:signal transduction histidine kinase
LQQAIQVAPDSLFCKGNGGTAVRSQTVGQFTAYDARPAVELNFESDLYLQPWQQAYPDGSILIVPIKNRSKVLGLIVLQRCQSLFWCDSDYALAEMVATQMSGALLQVQTLRQVQSLVEKRTSQLQRSIEVQGKLYEQTRRQIDQLRHLNQLKDEFLSAISHELLTPLTSMRLAARMLRQSHLSEERRQAYLDILEQQCTQETGLINDLLALQQVETQPVTLNLQQIDLKLLLQEWLQSWSLLWEDKELSLQLNLPDDTLPMQTDVESLHRILRELITNASKYSYPQEIMTLHVMRSDATTVAAQDATQDVAETETLVIAITNRGAGIPAQELPHIFDKFRRGQEAMAQAIQGTGLGLALVRCLVQQLEGSITADSALVHHNCWETTFTLTLPQRYNWR